MNHFVNSHDMEKSNLPGDSAMLSGICPDYAADGVTVPRLFRYYESLWMGLIRGVGIHDRIHSLGNG